MKGLRLRLAWNSGVGVSLRADPPTPDLAGQVTQASSLGIISESEAALSRDAKALDIINVDGFAPHELGVGASTES